jgi:hypothetical protein
VGGPAETEAQQPLRSRGDKLGNVVLRAWTLQGDVLPSSRTPEEGLEARLCTWPGQGFAAIPTEGWWCVCLKVSFGVAEHLPVSLKPFTDTHISQPCRLRLVTGKMACDLRTNSPSALSFVLCGLWACSCPGSGVLFVSEGYPSFLLLPRD